MYALHTLLISCGPQHPLCVLHVPFPPPYPCPHPPRPPPRSTSSSSCCTCLSWSVRTSNIQPNKHGINWGNLSISIHFHWQPSHLTKLSLPFFSQNLTTPAVYDLGLFVKYITASLYVHCIQEMFIAMVLGNLQSRNLLHSNFVRMPSMVYHPRFFLAVFLETFSLLRKTFDTKVSCVPQKEVEAQYQWIPPKTCKKTVVFATGPYPNWTLPEVRAVDPECGHPSATSHVSLPAHEAYPFPCAHKGASAVVS